MKCQNLNSHRRRQRRGGEKEPDSIDGKDGMEILGMGNIYISERGMVEEKNHSYIFDITYNIGGNTEKWMTKQNRNDREIHYISYNYDTLNIKQTNN